MVLPDSVFFFFYDSLCPETTMVLPDTDAPNRVMFSFNSMPSLS